MPAVSAGRLVLAATVAMAATALGVAAMLALDVDVRLAPLPVEQQVGRSAEGATQSAHRPPVRPKRRRTGWRAAPLVSGTVRDQAGRPVPDAEVRVGGKRTQTDGRGRFELRGEPGHGGRVEILGPGHRSVTLRSGGRDLDVRVERDARPLVRIVSPELPVWQGTLVELRDARYQRNAPVHRVRASAAGTLSVHGLRRGTYRVTMPAQRVEDRPFARTDTRVEIPSDPSIHLPVVEFAPVPGEVISGSVTDPDGAPLPDAEVVAWTPRPGRRSRTHAGHRTRSDPEGRFEVIVAAGTRASHVTAVVHSQGKRTGMELAPSIAEWVPAGTTDVELKLSQGGSISGVLLDPAGHPAAGVRMVAYHSAPRRRADTWIRKAPYPCAVTDHEGRFTFEGLLDARFRLTTHVDERIRRKWSFERVVWVGESGIEIRPDTVTKRWTGVTIGSVR